MNEELQKIEWTHQNNGYRERFIEENMNERPHSREQATGKRKEPYTQLLFKGDGINYLVRRLLAGAIVCNFLAAILRAS